MKCRTGFVSNSSSSSFVLAVKSEYVKGKHPKKEIVQTILGLPETYEDEKVKKIYGTKLDIVKDYKRFLEKYGVDFFCEKVARNFNSAIHPSRKKNFKHFYDEDSDLYYFANSIGFSDNYYRNIGKQYIRWYNKAIENDCQVFYMMVGQDANGEHAWLLEQIFFEYLELKEDDPRFKLHCINFRP